MVDWLSQGEVGQLQSQNFKLFHYIISAIVLKKYFNLCVFYKDFLNSLIFPQKKKALLKKRLQTKLMAFKCPF